MSQWRNREVTVIEGRGPGEAGQECSRHDQDRPGVVRSQGEERGQAPPSLSLLVALQVRQDPAGRQEDTQEAGGEPNGDILHREQGRRNPQSKDQLPQASQSPSSLLRWPKAPLRKSGLRFQRRDVADPRSTLGPEVKCQIQWWGSAGLGSMEKSTIS